MTSGNVYARIAAAYQDIAAETFEKTGTVAGSGGGYKFIPIGQILNIVRRAHGKHGVIVVFGKPEYDADQGEGRTKLDKTTKNSYGETRTTTWHYAIGHIDVKIFGGSDDDYIETSVPFEVQDNSDKLTNKIITNAERCLYRTLYAIDEGGEDPESVNETNEIVSEKKVAAPPTIQKKVACNVPETDKFFGRKEPSKKESVKEAPASASDITTADSIPTEEELNNFLNVKGALPQHKEVVKAFKINKGAKSVYDLSFEDKVELYNIIAITEGSA